MSEHLVTQDERAALRRLAKHWPRERRRSIAEFVCEVVDRCPKCGEPVRRNDSRASAGKEFFTGSEGWMEERFRVGHLRCVTGTGPPPPRGLEPL